MRSDCAGRHEVMRLGVNDSGDLEGIAVAGKRSLRFAASLKLMRSTLLLDGDMRAVRLDACLGPRSGYHSITSSAVAVIIVSATHSRYLHEPVGCCVPSNMLT